MHTVMNTWHIDVAF